MVPLSWPLEKCGSMEVMGHIVRGFLGTMWNLKSPLAISSFQNLAPSFICSLL